MKRRTRMYEPWGYQDQNDYQGVEFILENDLESFFAEVSYNKDDNKIHFANKDGEEKATIDVNEFVKSQVIVEKAWYENGSIHVKFTNGDEIVVDVKELLDENEFKDGLQVVEGQVSVLINTAESDEYISVGEAGIKLFGVKRDIEAEEARAISAETALDEKIDAEIERATSAEETLDEKIDAEIERATAEETRIDTKLDQEIARATAEEAAANRRIDSLNDELDAEKTIREAADAALGRRIDKEIDDRTADVDEEEARAIAAEEALDEKIDAEIARATSAETQLQGNIEAEGQRAQAAETALDGKIDTEIAERKAEAVATAEYVKGDNKIYFKNANNEAISEVDTTDFVVDGMVEDVKIENGNLVITFNTDAGKQDITIPLTEIFDPSNYYTKDDVDEKVATINENIVDEASARESGDTALDGKIDALEAVVDTKANTTDVNAALDLKADKTEIPTDFYTKGEVDGKDDALQAAIDSNTEAISVESARAISAETDIETALSGKADADVVYTQEEVDALLAEKEAEMQVKYGKLKDMVLDLYYATTYSVPTDCGLDTMLKSNNGEAKLTEDLTIGTIAAGTTAKNIVKLNLGGKTVTFTGNTTTNPAMMFRNKQQVNIGGSGTIDAGGRIAIEAYGADCEITLSGTMFGRPTYVTDRSGGELIYCYLGTINITEGIFKNLGEDKSFLLNCYDTNYRAGTAKIIVTGGKFYDFNPADNSAEGEHTNFLAEGYHVETSTVTEEGVEHTVYTVKKDA